MAGNNLGLKQAPFQDTFSDAFYYASPPHEKLLVAMEEGIRQDRGVAVVVGDAGSGKTVLACKLLCRFEGDDRRVFVTCAPDAPGDLIRQVCMKFNVEADPSQSPAEHLVQLRERIEADEPENRLHVVVLDAADQLGREGLKQLDMLTGMRAGKGYALQIAVFGRPQLLRLLQLREYPDICRRVASAERIAPFTREEMSGYIRHRVAAAGADADRLFSEDALALLCELSGGLPGVANVIGSAAVERAGACGAGTLTSEIIRQSQSAGERTGQADVGSPAPEAQTAPDVSGRQTEKQRDLLAEQIQGVGGLADGGACALEHQVEVLTARAEVAVRRLRSAIEEVDTRAAAAEAQLDADTMESLVERTAQTMIEAGKRATAIEDRLGELMGSTEAAIEAFKAASEEVRTRGLAAMEERFGQLMANAEQAVEQLRSASEEVETRGLTALEERQGKLTERAEAAAENLSAILREIEAHRAAVESGVADAQAACSDAGESSHRLAVLSAEIESSSEAAQERVNLLAAGLEASEGAHQRLLTLSADVGDQVSKLLDFSGENLARLQSAIQESVKSREAIVQSCEDSVARVDGQSRAMVERSEAAGATLRSEIELAQGKADEIQLQLLARVREAIQSEIMPAVREEMESLRSATTGAIREMIDKGIEEAAVLVEERRIQAETSIEEAVRNHMQAVDDRLSQADRISADLTMNMQTVDAKANELASCVTSAGDAVQALSNATGESWKTIQTIDQQTRATAQLREELARDGEAITNEVKIAGETTHSMVKDLLEKVEAGIQQAERSLQAARQEKASVDEVTERAIQVSSEAERCVRVLNQTLEDVNAQGDAVRERLNETARQIEKRANDARAQMEEEARELNAQGDRLMADLTRRIDSRMESLDERIDAVQTARSQLISTAEAARRHAELLESQVETARDLMASQAKQADEHREVIEELTSQIRKGQSLTSQFEGIKEDALQTHAELARRSEVAVALFERASELLKHIDDRESEIEMQGQILASLNDEREALELRVRQVQTSIESLRLELTSLLTQPQKLVCDAKSQAVQLHDVCRAVKKVFAGLSQASLNASQRIDQLKRLEAVAGALQGWVAETANAQQRLTTALTPVLAGPAPVIATVESDERGDRASIIAPPKRAMPRPGQRGGAVKPAVSAAAQKARAQQIDRLIREARAQAASVPVGT